MERVTARRGVLRISTSVLLALALLFFLMPFVTAGCDPSVTYNGIDFIEGDSSEFPTGGEENGGEDESAGVLDSGAAPITLAVVFAGLGVIVGLLPGLVAVAAGYAAAAVTAGALVAFMLSGSLRGSSSAFVDFRYGFWPALALSAAASIVAWLRWQAFPRVVTHATVPEKDVGDDPDVTRFFPLSGALAPGVRNGEAWDAAALVGVPFLAAAALLVLARQPSRLAAWALIGLGVGWTLAALQDAAYFAASDHYSIGDGTYLALLGSLALSGAGFGGRSSTYEAGRFALASRALVVAGAVGTVVGTIVPFERDFGLKVALLHGGHSATRWLALQPIVLALLAVAAAWFLPRARAAAALIGLSATLLFTYVALLSPLFDNEDDTAGPADVGAGAFIGAAGAVLILAGALIALRRRSDQ